MALMENAMGSLALVATLAVAIYVYLKKAYSYWSDRKVPSARAWPFIGSQWKVLSMQKHRVDLHREIYERYPEEKIVGGYVATKPELIIRDPEIIRMILLKDFNHFVDRPFPAIENLLGQNLFQIKGEKWRMLRQKLTPTFTSAKMKQMFPLIVDCGQMLQNQLLEAINKDEIQELRDITARFTTDTIGSCAFGLNMQSMSETDSEFRKFGRVMFSQSKISVVLELIFTLMPKLAKMLPIIKISKRHRYAENFMVSIVSQMLESRANTPSNRHDFMDLMMQLKTKGTLEVDKNDKLLKGENKDEAFVITDSLITAQAFVFFLAGFETSSTLISYALFELSRNPEIQDKLAEEIRTVLKKHNGQVTYDAVQEMVYLDMVISETLRKYPSLAFLTRECNQQYTIPGTGVTIDKGVQVIIPMLALHHDPQYFPDPEKFKPERFQEGVEKTYHPFAYLPFGDGPRNCIGLRFGKLQAATGLISILEKCSVERCEKTTPEIEFQPAQFVSAPKTGIWLRIKRRQTSATVDVTS